MDNADIAILSLFNRGNWLASELSQAGFKVALIDLSSLFSRWTPSDWEGPFGIFQSQSLNDSQLFFLFEGESLVEAEKGFCIWPKLGPVEFRGPLHSDYFSKHLDREVLEKAITRLDVQVKENLKNHSFEKVWPAYFAYHFASSTYFENTRAIDNNICLDLFSNYYFRQASRLGLNDALRNCETQGVKVYSDASISDISIKNKLIENIEVSQGSRAFLQGSKKWVNMLTTNELSVLEEKNSSKLFINDPIEPDWAWLRFSLEYEANAATAALPSQFVIMNDIYSPWYHSNLLQVLKSSKSNEVDVWLKAPTAQRFQRQYLEDIKEELCNILTNKIPEFKIKNFYMPQEYTYGFGELGPPRFAIYKKNFTKNRQKIKNLRWSCPEDWQQLDWASVLNEQKKIYNDLIAERKEEEKKDRKND